MANAVASNQKDVAMKVSLSIGSILLLSFIWWVYQPGVNGPLLLDDWENLSVLESAPVNDWDSLRTFVFGNASGPTGRPVSMLSFLWDGQSWPLNVAESKLTNIHIHLLCTLSLLILAACVFKSVGVDRSRIHILVLCSGALWALHPLNVSTVLYLIQRMTQLATLFSLLALVFFFLGRTLIIKNAATGLTLLLVALFPFGVLAVLAKENGVLLLASIIIIELTLFQKMESSKSYRLWFRFGVILPLCLFVIYLGATFTDSLESYGYRSFNMLERLLTESRILVHYTANIFLPQIAGFGLYHDDIVVSRGLFHPLTTILSLGSIFLLLVLAVRMRGKEPMFSFAVLWFFVWHFLESTYLPLELYFEHRNYLPMIGPVLAGVYYLHQGVDLVKSSHSRLITSVLAVVSVLYLTNLTLQLTRLWGRSGTLISHWAEQHPTSVRAQSDLALILASIGASGQGLHKLQSLLQIYPQDLSLQLRVFNYSCTNGLQAPQPLQQISAIDDPEIFRRDVNSEVRVLIDNLRIERCEYPDRSEMLELMGVIEALEMDPRREVIFSLLYSELLVHYGLIDEALEKIDNAFDIEPSIDIAIRQATLAGSVGRFSDALVILDKAYDVDERRSILLPSRRNEIDDWRMQIEALL